MSSSPSKYLSTARIVTFSTTILFSLIVMSLSADLISIAPPGYQQYDISASIALATSLLSMLTVAIMLVVDILRQGSIFSYVIVEIAWLSILWVLWLTSGSYAAWEDGLITFANSGGSSCSFGFSFDPSTTPVTQGCQVIKAISAFSFLTWILLMSYTIMLLVLAIRAQGRGNSAWTTGVRDGILFYPVQQTTGGAAQVQTAMATIPYSLPSPQQPSPQKPLPPPPPPQQVYLTYSSYPIPQV